MDFITMWRLGIRKCMLVVGREQVMLRLVEGGSILREELVAPRFAARLAESWKIEQRCAEWQELVRA